MKITACVCYPVYVEVEVPDTASEEEKREALLNEADLRFEDSFPEGVLQGVGMMTSSITPVITECSDESISG